MQGEGEQGPQWVLCGYPTLHTAFNKKEETGTREYSHQPHLTGKTSWSQSLKENPGRNIKILEEAGDQWKTVSKLDTAAPRQPRCTSPRTPSPIATLRAPFGPGCGAGAVGEPSPNSSAGFRGSQNQKLTSTRGG